MDESRQRLLLAEDVRPDPSLVAARPMLRRHRDHPGAAPAHDEKASA